MYRVSAVFQIIFFTPSPYTPTLYSPPSSTPTVPSATFLSIYHFSSFYPLLSLRLSTFLFPYPSTSWFLYVSRSMSLSLRTLFYLCFFTFLSLRLFTSIYVSLFFFSRFFYSFLFYHFYISTYVALRFFAFRCQRRFTIFLRFFNYVSRSLSSPFFSLFFTDLFLFLYGSLVLPFPI